MLDPSFDLVTLASTLRRGASRLHRRVRAEGSAGGLSLLALRLLADAARADGETATEMALRDGIKQQSLTRGLADLERRRLIVRRPDPNDRRRRRIVVTPAGLSHLQREGEVREGWLVAAMRATLQPNEIAALGVAAPLLERLGLWRPDAEAQPARPAISAL
jgi:DNA-binding MarR family transcriptional regulator